MLSIFKKNNIEPIKSIDQKLDPNLHQAMMEIEDLRPSLVGVSKKEVREDHKKAENPQKNEEKQ